MNKKMSEIKNENRKEFKKFAVIMIICAIFGGVVGFILSMYGDVIKDIPSNLNAILISILPYSICVAGIISFISSFILYRKSVKLYEKYDGENEVLIDKIENSNGYALIINNINLIITFFFFGIALDDNVFDLDKAAYKFLIFFLSYLINIAIIVKMQQKIIDFEKLINPEKKGSVYDKKFTKKWEESCDEAERMMIYKSSYKAFKTTNITCIIVWLALVMINTVWNTGVMPVVVVTIIWAVLVCSYSIEAMRLQKTGGK